MKKICSLLVCAATVLGLSQTPVKAANSISQEQIIKNDTTGIVDKSLYGSMLLAGDSNKDGILTKEEAKVIHTIKIETEAKNIDLKGLEFAPSTTELRISGIDTTLTNMHYLSRLQSLEVLSLNKMAGLNGIDRSVVSGLKNIRQLEMTNCNLNDDRWVEYIPNPSKLEILNLNDNKIAELNFIDSPTNLKKLFVKNNALSRIYIPSSFSKLVELDLSHNQIGYISDFKKLTSLDFNKVDLSSNQLTKRDLQRIVPDTIKNYPDWIEKNVGKIGVQIISYKENEEFPMEQLKNALNDKWTEGIEIDFYNNIIPQEAMSLIKKSGKYIVTTVNGVSIGVGSASMPGIEGDLDLNVEFTSIYEDKIKQLTGEDNLLFASFKANQTIKKESLFSDRLEYPILISYDYNPFIKIGDADSNWEKVTVYGYNETDNSIIKIGKIVSGVAANVDPKTGEVYNGYIKVVTDLKKGYNTLFIAHNDNLERGPSSIPVINPSIGEKVITDDTLSEKNIINALQDSSISSVTINLKKVDSISIDLLNSIKESGKPVTFNILNDDNTIKYSWSFTGNDIKNTVDNNLDLDIRFQSDKQKEIESITKQTGMFYLQFAYHGKLPAPTTIRVDVRSKYADGETVNLYYFNEEKNEVEKVNSNIKVENGYVTFTIDHCSTYFLAEGELNNGSPVKTSDTTTIFGAFITMIVTAGAVVLMKKKEEKE